MRRAGDARSRRHGLLLDEGIAPRGLLGQLQRLRHPDGKVGTRIRRRTARPHARSSTRAAACEAHALARAAGLRGAKLRPAALSRELVRIEACGAHACSPKLRASTAGGCGPPTSATSHHAVRSAAGCRTCSSTIRRRRRRATSDARFAVRRMGRRRTARTSVRPSNLPSPTARNGARPREEIGRLPVIRTFYLRTLHAAAKTAPYTGQNFERQTNHGLRRSSSL